MIQILPRRETNLEAFSNLGANLLNTIIQAKQLKREQAIRSELAHVLGGQRSMTDFLQQPIQPRTSGGLAGALDFLNPMTPAGSGTSQLEDIIFGKLLEQAYPRPYNPGQALSALKLNYIMNLPPEEQQKAMEGLIRGLTVNVGTAPEYSAYQTEEERIEDARKRAEAARAKTEADKIKAKQETLPAKSSTENAGATARNIIKSLSPGAKILPPWGSNFTRDMLISAYKNYRAQTGYDSLTEPFKKAFDNIWDNQIESYNKGGYPEHGKNEFDWDPKDTEVLKLRQQQAGGETSGKGTSGAGVRIEKTVPTGGASTTGQLQQPTAGASVQEISQPPPDLQGAAYWPSLSKAARLNIWQGYREGLTAEEMDTIAQVELKARRMPPALIQEIQQAMRAIDPATGKPYTIRDIVKTKALRDALRTIQ